LGWTAPGYTVRPSDPRSCKLFVGLTPNMEDATIFIAIFVAVFVPVILMLVLSGERWRAAQDRARARRIADAKMNARLLRLNI